MDISSLLNTDLGNLNESSLILQDGRLSMHNTIYIFLKFTCPISKKTKTYFLTKTIKAFFSKPKIWLVELKVGFCVSSLKNTQTGDPRQQSMNVNQFETINIFPFNNAFMMRSVIILTVTLSSDFSAFGVKFKTEFHVTVHCLSLANC